MATGSWNVPILDSRRIKDLLILYLFLTRLLAYLFIYVFFYITYERYYIYIYSFSKDLQHSSAQSSLIDNLY